MKSGLWVWPPDQKAQMRMLRKVSASPHLIAALTAVSKSKAGLSNSELDDVTADNSNWMTLWVVRQLTSLGFIEFSVALFGGPAKYLLTDLGRSALSTITGQPPQSRPVPPPSPPAAAPPKVA
ncbi:MAG: hypothetical protein HY247_06045 [archaeon]|nr:MAG: hypothetical protein HY247_06045 [archaeon]